MTPRPPDARPASALSSKILPRHRDRLAIVYVRQSTPQQLLHHQESTRMQYNLVERAVAFGWSRERVLVIDDDLGRSGASAEGRPGFQRLVTEVSLDHVGLLLGVEVSRLARNCRDWHQLLEVCSVFGTLISDLDGVYDPALVNDRLLLGLKGTMSEAELHTIKMRMHAGRNAKAARGELGRQVPIGDVRRPSGEVIQEPDAQARTIVATIVAQFERRGTLHGVLCYFVEHDLQVPVRVHSGPDRGDLEWRRPNRMTLQNVLNNPIYAGAYVWGRRATDPRTKKPARPSTGRRVVHPGDWSVCLRDRVPAYITWARYEANLAQLALNRQVHRGAPRQGAALLAGLVRCGRCGRRMAAQDNAYVRYACVAELRVYAGPPCQSLVAGCVDVAVEALLLRALQPAALDVSLAVAADLDAERARLEALWQQRLERAQYDVDRSRRQDNAVEPENRLVARTVERQLEAHLSAQLTLQEEHRRDRAARPATLTEDERAMIRRLAADLPALWHSPTTTPAQKKAIVRHLVDDVSVTVDGASERVAVTVTWVGGHRTELRVVRPVAKLTQLSYYGDLVARAHTLRRDGKPHAQIADALNAEGWRPAKRRDTFTAAMVTGLLASRDDVARPRTRRVVPDAQRREHEWTLPALAHALDMHAVTLHSWVRKAWVKGRKVPSANPAGMWLLWADADELARLRALRTTTRTRWPRSAT